MWYTQFNRTVQTRLAGWMSDNKSSRTAFGPSPKGASLTEGTSTKPEGEWLTLCVLVEAGTYAAAVPAASHTNEREGFPASF